LAVSLMMLGGCEAPVSSTEASGLLPGLEPPAVRHQVDVRRSRVWFVGTESVTMHEASRPERRVLVLPDWIVADVLDAGPPGLALGPGGEAVVTSNVLPVLWRIDPETLAVSTHPLALDADTDKDVGFSGLVYSAQHAAYFAVNSTLGSLWRIDRELTRAQKIPVSPSIAGAWGLEIPPRSARHALARTVDLCAYTPRGGLSVRFAPDQRSAYAASVAACAEASGLPPVAMLKGE